MSFVSTAETETVELDIFSISLEELLNIKVSVAEPIGEESIINTPAIVSRYDVKTMEKFGHRTLVDILNSIPGIEVKRNLAGLFTILMRGLQDPFNQKVLFLLDGVPYYQFTHSFIPLSGIPIEGISHVEVIRGPGSVIYGTNASAGVINIVTRKNNVNRVSFSLGDADYSNVGGHYSKSLGDHKQVFMAFEKQNGGQFNSYFDQGFSSSKAGDVSIGNKADSIIGGLTWENTNLSLSAFKVTNTGINTESNVDNTGDVVENSTLIHIDHTFNLEKSKLKFYADHNNYYHSFEFNNSVAISPGNSVRTTFRENEKNYRLRAGTNLNWNFNENISLFFGAEYENRSTGNYHSINLSTGEPTALLDDVLPESVIYEASLFSQVDYQIGDIRLTGGLRYTDHETAGDRTTAKASIVYKMSPDKSLKFLYSEGFNSPNGIQTGITGLPIVVGNEDLKPESVTTYDLAYSYSKENTLFVANLYALKVEDGIDRKLNPSGPGLIYDNANEFKRYGIEVDFQRVNDQVTTFTNLSYIHKANEVLADDTSNVLSPRYIFAIGSSYQYHSNQILGVSFEYKSERKTASGDKDIKENYLVNINYEYQYKNLQLFSTLNNVFNEDIREPDVNKSEVTFNTRPDGPTIIAGIKATF
jgi:outer membrane receptor for ferrienterochelin and colicins